jgi:hypothetical protein
MDVSVKRSAAEFYANVIARSDDLRDDNCISQSLRCSVVAVRCRRAVVAAVVAAGDYVRFRSLRFAPTHIHRPYSADAASAFILPFFVYPYVSPKT